MGFRVGAPAPNLGYNRTTDWPVAGGQGGKTTNAGGGLTGMLSLKSQATPGSPGNWHPTVLWMLGFVIAELVLFGYLSRHLKL
jgi:hypothetical protein